MAFRYVLPALAVAIGQVAAQNGCSGTTTIENSGDAEALSSCSTYSGDITIATGTTDNIALDGIQRIDGSLIARKVDKLTTLSADSLTQIDDSFTLRDLQILSTLNFPQLSTVDTVAWEGLPNLQALSFTTGLSKVGTLNIQNTLLGSFDGIDLEEVDELYVTNNEYLTDITMPLTMVSTGLTLQANGRDATADFPDLKWAYNMTIWNCSSVSIPSLSAVNGSIGFYSNTFESLSAPNLTETGGGVAFIANNALTNISMPMLEKCGGGLQIAANKKLDTIDGFPKLETVSGAVDFHGPFEDVELPQLNDVKGAFNLQSTEDISDACAEFKPLSGGRGNVIKGPFTCKGQTKPKGVGSLKPGTSSGGGSGDNDDSGASALYISGATGVLGVVAALFVML